MLATVPSEGQRTWSFKFYFFYFGFDLVLLFDFVAAGEAGLVVVGDTPDAGDASSAAATPCSASIALVLLLFEKMSFPSRSIIFLHHTKQGIE